jgi:cytochrome c nitrite reductase small subunit
MTRFRWLGLAAVFVAAGVGVLAGVGSYTFVYAKGGSYLTNDPAACANCHVMQSHYDAWVKSSHRNVATCNDCHTPHDPVGKYATKALNGFNHSLAFTTGRFHEPLQITPRNRAITEAACRYCHADVVQMIDRSGAGADVLSCIRCHENVGHDR